MSLNGADVCVHGTYISFTKKRRTVSIKTCSLIINNFKYKFTEYLFYRQNRHKREIFCRNKKYQQIFSSTYVLCVCVRFAH